MLCKLPYKVSKVVHGQAKVNLPLGMADVVSCNLVPVFQVHLHAEFFLKISVGLAMGVLKNKMNSFLHTKSCCCFFFIQQTLNSFHSSATNVDTETALAAATVTRRIRATFMAVLITATTKNQN